MTRTLTITAAEVPAVLAAIESGEPLVLVRPKLACEIFQPKQQGAQP